MTEAERSRETETQIEQVLEGLKLRERRLLTALDGSQVEIEETSSLSVQLSSPVPYYVLSHLDGVLVRPASPEPEEAP